MAQENVEFVQRTFAAYNVGDLGAGDRVLARAMWRGSGSGPDAAMEFTYLFTLREGRIITIQMYWDHDEALGAAGLSE